jgi:DNA-directed RNA polymerase specialized sigma24 family protein
MGEMTRDVGGKTYAEIGQLLGISHTRVQQLEARALRKMRKRATLLGIDLAAALSTRPKHDNGALLAGAGRGRR